MSTEIKDKINSNVKDSGLVDKKRQEIINASVQLFIKKGFHKTSVRDITRESGISMGSLYDYISTKEDILFLVCDHIHNSVLSKLKQSISQSKNSFLNLENGISEYFRIIDENQDYMLLLYQETKSLNKMVRKYIYDAETELVEIFEGLLQECIKDKAISLKKSDVYLVANNIMVLGHMWAFRRWTLSSEMSIENFIRKQTKFIFNGIVK